MHKKLLFYLIKKANDQPWLQDLLRSNRRHRPRGSRVVWPWRGRGHVCRRGCGGDGGRCVRLHAQCAHDPQSARGEVRATEAVQPPLHLRQCQQGHQSHSMFYLGLSRRFFGRHILRSFLTTFLFSPP